MRTPTKKSRLDRFLDRVTAESLEETLGWLYEDERERQKDMES